MNKLKLLFHASLEKYHAVMMDSLMHLTGPEGTKLYLEHWTKYTHHKDAAKKCRDKALRIKLRDSILQDELY